MKTFARGRVLCLLLLHTFARWRCLLFLWPTIRSVALYCNPFLLPSLSSSLYLSLCFSRPLSVSLHRPQRVVYRSFLFSATTQLRTLRNMFIYCFFVQTISYTIHIWHIYAWHVLILGPQYNRLLVYISVLFANTLYSNWTSKKVDCFIKPTGDPPTPTLKRCFPKRQTFRSKSKLGCK